MLSKDGRDALMFSQDGRGALVRPADHRVVFCFRLPPVLLLHAEPGRWPRAPRGAAVNVGGDGTVTITSVDHSEVFARAQVQRVAAAWLRENIRHQAPRAIAATLSAPSCRARPERYAIALDARVSIAKTAEAPFVAGAGAGLPVA